MKICAVRGQNLASLERFEVAFDQGPLAESRLFSIWGPTGSGKSSLLDALCLALYDRVPRLVEARDEGGGPAGTELSPQDPRLLMRRGTGEAFAEVDFEGRDGRRYRARWEAWRARRSPEGRFQPVRVRLFRTDPFEELSGKHRTETLETIRDRVGLGFDEFRRAILLAQGDFAAFLKSRPQERAAILERMTGTERFSALSIEAHRRHRAEEAELQRLHDARQGLEVWADEERGRAEIRARTLAETRRALRSRIDGLRQRIEWASALETARAEADEARRALAEAEVAWEGAAQLRAERDRIQRAHELLSALDKRASSRADQAAQAHRIETASEARTRSAVQVAEAEAAVQAARARWERLGALGEALAPVLRRARELDAELQAAGRRAKATEADRAERRRSLEAALDESLAVREAEGLQAGRIPQARAADPILVEHGHFLVREAERWADNAGALEAAQNRLAEIDRELTRCSEARRSAQRLHESRSEARRQHRDRVEAARKAVLEHRCRGTPRDAFDGLTRLGQLMARVDELTARLEADKKRVTEKRKTERKVEQMQRALKKNRADLRRVVRRRRQLEGEFEQLRSKIYVDRLKSEVHRHRDALLEDGAACPLCGASAEDHAPVDPPIEPAEADRRLGKLEDQMEKLLPKRHALERDEERLTDRLKSAKEKIGELERELTETRRPWAELREALELVWVDSPVLARMQVQRTALRLGEVPELAPLEQVRTDLSAADGDLRGHMEADDAANRALDAARAEAQKVEAEAQASAEAFDRAVEAERARHQEQQLLEQRKSAAAHAVGACRDAIRGLLDPEGPFPPPDGGAVGPWLEELRDAVADATRRTEARERGLSELRSLRAKRERADARLREAHRGFEGARAADETARAALRTAEVERGHLFDGRSAESIEAEHATRREAARVELEQAESGQRQAERERERLDRELFQARTRHEALTTELSTLEEDLSARAAEAGFESLDQVEAVWARGPEHRNLVLERVERLERNRHAAQVTLADRQQRVDRMLVEGVEPPDGAELGRLRSQLGELEAELEQSQQQLFELEQRLSADEAQRARRDRLDRELEGQRARVRLTADLSEVIGASDGKKFRSFAQGLSLELLVQQANLHLARLRPRYRLERSPGRDIDLRVIDRDLGGEVRAVSTLSGGETFLVSLALALALSSSSSKNLRIDSLFIDEGFGHLDRESLESAIGTLDELQSDGRTIGIVSHVPEVAERIGYAIEIHPIEPGRSTVHIRAG